METTLNQLLNEMDGFEENDRIIVVAATNLASSLDPALQRPGRFDHKIEVTLPNLEDRKEIIKIHLKNVSFKSFILDNRNRIKLMRKIFIK
jgi:ATP-dependent Zn protease